VWGYEPWIFGTFSLWVSTDSPSGFRSESLRNLLGHFNKYKNEIFKKKIWTFPNVIFENFWILSPLIRYVITPKVNPFVIFYNTSDSEQCSLNCVAKNFTLEFLIVLEALGSQELKKIKIGLMSVFMCCNVQRNPSFIRLWNATLSNCRHDTTQPNQDQSRSRPTHKTFIAVKKETKSAPHKRMKRLRLLVKFGMRRRAEGLEELYLWCDRK
jgi:hypothetical protein